MPNTEGRLVDENDQDVPIGEPGELWLRGPGLMKWVSLSISNGRDSWCGREYVGNPKATAETITPDGWLRTGDIAVYHPEGFLTIVDRRKELIKYKGFQGKRNGLCLEC